MKYSSKGFTLIELLSVIVILAILAMIAAPIVLKVINNARRSATEDSVYGILQSGEVFHSDRKLDNPNTTFQEVRFRWEEGIIGAFTYNDVTGAFDIPMDNAEVAKFKFNGNAPTSGEIIISHTGQVSINDEIGLTMNGFICKHKDTNTTVIECS